MSNDFTGCIYQITNKTNGKIYIGQTTRSIEQRWREHCRDSSVKSSILSKAIKKYGEKNFTLKIIDSSKDINDLNKKEIKYIKEFKSIQPIGYNIQNGGFGKGKFTQESRDKISNSHKGKKVSKETRLKLSIASRRKWNTLEFREKHQRSMRKVAESQEWRGKISKSSKKMWENREFKDKMSEIHRGRKKTWKHLKAMKEGMRKARRIPFDVYKAVFSHKEGRTKVFKAGEYIGTWNNQVECMEYFGFGSPHKISACLNNKRTQHKGYIFKYK